MSHRVELFEVAREAREHSRPNCTISIETAAFAVRAIDRELGEVERRHEVTARTLVGLRRIVRALEKRQVFGSYRDGYRDALEEVIHLLDATFASIEAGIEPWAPVRDDVP